MIYNERGDSYSLPFEAGKPTVLTGRAVPTKTESISVFVDKITGDDLRLQLF
jgi:hypothetical protein